jgi:hypothetical protein
MLPGHVSIWMEGQSPGGKCLESPSTLWASGSHAALGTVLAGWSPACAVAVCRPQWWDMELAGLLQACGYCLVA